MAKRAPFVFNRPTSSMETHLLPEEKLAILQLADPRRKWQSLDDQRVCVICGRAITGRQIEVRREPAGGHSVHCPTPRCPALPSDWFYRGHGCATEKTATSRSAEVNLWSV